jgi:hypothetical protein
MVKKVAEKSKRVTKKVMKDKTLKTIKIQPPSKVSQVIVKGYG